MLACCCKVLVKKLQIDGLAEHRHLAGGDPVRVAGEHDDRKAAAQQRADQRSSKVVRGPARKRRRKGD